MRLKLLTIPCIFFLAITLIIAGCSKDGDTGPAGAAGAQGPAGPTGAAGGPGAQGAPGTANVIYSPWLNVTFQGGSDTTAWVAEIIAPKLVDSILNKGDVKVYWNAGSDSANSQFIIPLPVYDPFLIGIVINVYFQKGKIILVAAGGNPSSVIDNGNNYSQFRYILIPGGTAGRSAAGGKTVDWNNYKSVQDYLGLKD